MLAGGWVCVYTQLICMPFMYVGKDFCEASVGAIGDHLIGEHGRQDNAGLNPGGSVLLTA